MDERVRDGARVDKKKTTTTTQQIKINKAEKKVHLRVACVVAFVLCLVGGHAPSNNLPVLRATVIQIAHAMIHKNTSKLITFTPVHLPPPQYRQASPFFVLSVSWSEGLCLLSQGAAASSARPASTQACPRMGARRRRTRRKTRQGPRTHLLAIVRPLGGVWEVGLGVGGM